MPTCSAYDNQGGPRGGSKAFAAGMIMGMAQRPIGEAGTLGFRAMLSPDPFMGANGYPPLFATGETANGRMPLIDRQRGRPGCRAPIPVIPSAPTLLPCIAPVLAPARRCIGTPPAEVHRRLPVIADRDA